MRIGQGYAIVKEELAFSGVNKIAAKVEQDIYLVTGCHATSYHLGDICENLIIYGTIGKSEILCRLEESGVINCSKIRGKWEVYGFFVVDNPLPGVSHALVIAGSDKRGTIYGLFHLSEIMGVSPLVNWNHVWPRHQEFVEITTASSMISKEPSVKYRGFFINDEWPAFGNWAKEHFGGVNAKCYECIFELLLRLKGNYLWPAMWDSNFELDGPGLASAELADELGVVMSMSHHEPCMRSGGEYSLFRGKDSIYGDAWDFNTNEEGITRFWRDGLQRSRGFEQVITMGMRGENDTAIMANASLADNIQLVKRVIKTQNQLIRENVNTNLSEVPRQIVLFTEVEEFFYGDKTMPGLISDPELDGVTLMLSDNNAGYTRTLPSKAMLEHKGGYGMYYHMDMHGGPHSFQWIGSTYLPTVQDQMTTAYEFGVREIWVTNIGDIGTQEFGLSYFLDLAYDVNKFGLHGTVDVEAYRRKWVKTQFEAVFNSRDLLLIDKVLDSYLRLLSKRRHEALNDKTFHPCHFGEASDVLMTSERIISTMDDLKVKCPASMMGAFVSLIYYPACATANLFKLWIVSGRNKLYAKQGRVEANRLAELIPELLEADEAYVHEYMSVDEGYFSGFGLGEHIGFNFWNDENNRYPASVYVNPVKANRMVVARVNHSDYLTGGYWSEMKPAVWEDALRPDVDFVDFEIACAGTGSVNYTIKSECNWLSFSKLSGSVDSKEVIRISIDRSAFLGEASGMFIVENGSEDKAKIIIKAYNPTESDVENAYWESDGFISVLAEHFAQKVGVSGGEFKILSPYGRERSAVKVFPLTADFENQENCPYLEYNISAATEGDYIVSFYLAPSTPVVFESKQYLGYSVNGDKMKLVNTVHDPSRPFFLSKQWEMEAISQIKIVEDTVRLNKGLNHLRFYGVSPQIILEKIVLRRVDIELPESCLGPVESYFHRKDLHHSNHDYS